ncbi:tetratricopeptide repeat protein [Streptomyces sp. NBC_00868]|uniref:tetratricopeptide repeat protein n=2 Tax=Streptomyces TaxID=1883 RepID=UPI003245751F|nr:tetratricopeptide repeat protein [Streptomyces sp. NBC_00868]
MTAPGLPDGEGQARIVQNVYAFGGFAYGAIHADVHVYGDGRPVYLLAEHRPPAGDPDPAWAGQPSRLLNAGNAVVPFTGREEELSELEDWCDGGDGGLAVRWLHGAGGRGKTRLADELAATSARYGWKTIVARHGGAVVPESGGSIDGRVGDRRGLLVLVDYADRWPLRDLAWLFANSVLGGSPGRRTPVRVLMLARSAHAWPAVKSVIGDRAATSDQELEALPADPGGREDVFAAARTRFAELYRRTDAATAPSSLPLEHPAFGLTLTVHMAALVAVDAHVHGRRPPHDTAGLSAYLLEREHEHWRRLYENGAAGLDFRTSPDDMASVSFVAALTGASTWEDGAAALERAALATAPEAVRSLLRDHARCYPPLDPQTVLEPLYPDRLAEDFLALTVPGHAVTGYRADAWATGVPKALLTAPGGAARAPRALTLLASAADRWPHLAEKVLYPLLRERADLAIDAGSAALVAIAGIPGADRASLSAIEHAAFAKVGGMPHVNLDTGLAAIAVRLATLTEPGATDAERARLHAHLNRKLRNAGQRAQALDHAQRAVDLYGELARADRGVHSRELAGALSALAIDLAHAGQRAEALERSQQAVDLYGELARADPEAHLPLLSEALGNHANRLADARRRAEALEVSERALGLIESLFEAATDPERYRGSLATALDNHANLLSEAGRHEEALDCSRRAADHYRMLGASDPAVSWPLLARLSHNDSIRHASAGDLTAAVADSALAAQNLIELAEINPSAHLPALAGALTAHTGHLWRFGLREEALVYSQRAVDAWDELADEDRRAHLPGLAAALRNHAVYLAQLGRQEQALDLSRGAIGLCEELVEADREAHLPDLARGLWAFALARTILDTDLDDALTAAARAARIYRDLAEHEPDEFTEDLLGGYALFADLLERRGLTGEASEFRLRTAKLRAKAAGAGPDGAEELERVFRAEAEAGHVPAMIDLGYLLAKAGRTEEAEPWYRRAAETGHRTAIALLAGLLGMTGRSAEAEPWLERSARAGDVTAMGLLGEWLARTGRGEEAEPWLRQAADAGGTDAMCDLGVLLEYTRRTEEAERYYRSAAEAGHLRAARLLGVLLYEAGRAEEAERFLRRAAEAGDAASMSNLGTLLYGSGRLPEAEQWYRRAVDAGFDRAMYDIAVLLERTRRTDEAEQWYRRAAETGHVAATAALATRLCESGRLQEAEPWLRRAAEAGNGGSMINLGLLLDRTGRSGEAESWLRRAVEAGEVQASGPLGSLLCEAGRLRDAEPWLRRAGDAGDVNAMMNMGFVLLHTGRRAEAEEWYRRAAAAGDKDAAKALRGPLFKAGRATGPGPRRRWGIRRPD